jgi:putative RecB family exonuclease
VSIRSLSPSSAALWSQCPRRWWFRYVDRLPEPPPGEPAVLGTFVHRILEVLLAEPADERTLERARAVARAVWPQVEASPDWVALELDETGGRRFRQRAWATVEAYFSRVTPAEVTAVACELEVQAEVAGVPFRGFVDLVEAAPGSAADEVRPDADAAGGPADTPAVIVTDYKTGRPPEQGRPWSAERDAERLLQPQWYAAALAALGTHRPVQARLLYFTAVEGRGVQRFAGATGELSAPVTTESLAAAGAELRRRWDEITTALERGDVESRPGPLCGWCPFVAECAAGQAECHRRWQSRNTYTGGRQLRDDAPAVALLGLDGRQPVPA